MGICNVKACYHVAYVQWVLKLGHVTMLPCCICAMGSKIRACYHVACTMGSKIRAMLHHVAYVAIHCLKVTIGSDQISSYACLLPTYQCSRMIQAKCNHLRTSFHCGISHNSPFPLQLCRYWNVIIDTPFSPLGPRS